MMIGSSGTRKSTAIKLIKSLMIQAGYTTFASDMTSKEKFLLDLEGEEHALGKTTEDILDRNLFGEAESSDYRPVAIFADEANDFFGHGNITFLSVLGSLWDYTGPPYTNRIKTGKSISIPNPTISILAGNTPTGFATAFPPDILGQGFFSRLLLIYGEPNGKKIAFPKTPDSGETRDIVDFLVRIRGTTLARYDYTDSGKKLLSHIYNCSKPIGDMRFDSYSQRRFIHLLKLCLIVAAANYKLEIDEQVVIEANTYLSYIETLMPKALGEFGKSKNSDVTHKILSYIENKDDGATMKELIVLTSSDFDKPHDLGDVLRKLSSADKIQTVRTVTGPKFIPMKKHGLNGDSKGTVDLSYLTAEELNTKG